MSDVCCCLVVTICGKLRKTTSRRSSGTHLLRRWVNRSRVLYQEPGPICVIGARVLAGIPRTQKDPYSLSSLQRDSWAPLQAISHQLSAFGFWPIAESCPLSHIGHLETGLLLRKQPEQV